MIKHESCPVAGLLDRSLPGAAVSLSMINWAGNGSIYINQVMGLESFTVYLHNTLLVLPRWHWAAMFIIAIGIAFVFVLQKEITTYRGVILGLVVFYGLFILDALVVSRLGRPASFEPALNLAAEYNRLVNGDKLFWLFLFFNILAFVPFGFLLFEVLPEWGRKRRWGIVVFTALGLSLIVESLQWILHVGFFEVTDIVLNTFGAAIGAAVALCLRSKIRA